MQILSWLRRTKPLPVLPDPVPAPIDPYRAVRELLRENLAVTPVDLFYSDDPLIGLPDNDRILYLKKFFDLFKDPFLTDRVKYHINNQAKKTIELSGNGVQDIAGAMNINGMAFIMDDIEKLANMYIKESTKPKEKFDKFEIIPKVGNL